MPNDPSEPVFQTEHAGWRVRGTRVSLDSVIYAHREGLSPVEIAHEFTTLTPALVEEVLAYYGRNRDAFDANLVQQENRWEELRKQSQEQNPELYARLRTARATLANRKESE